MKQIEFKITFNCTEKDYRDNKEIKEMFIEFNQMINDKKKVIPKPCIDFNMELITK